MNQARLQSSQQSDSAKGPSSIEDPIKPDNPESSTEFARTCSSPSLSQSSLGSGGKSLESEPHVDKSPTSPQPDTASSPSPLTRALPAASKRPNLSQSRLESLNNEHSSLAAAQANENTRGSHLGKGSRQQPPVTKPETKVDCPKSPPSGTKHAEDVATTASSDPSATDHEAVRGTSSSTTASISGTPIYSVQSGKPAVNLGASSSPPPSASHHASPDPPIKPAPSIETLPKFVEQDASPTRERLILEMETWPRPPRREMLARLELWPKTVWKKGHIERELEELEERCAKKITMNASKTWHVHGTTQYYERDRLKCWIMLNKHHSQMLPPGYRICTAGSVEELVTRAEGRKQGDTFEIR